MRIVRLNLIEGMAYDQFSSGASTGAPKCFSAANAAKAQPRRHLRNQFTKGD
jgi:hypothetical protein